MIIVSSTGEGVLAKSTCPSSLQSGDFEAARCINLYIHKVKKLSLSKRLIAICPEHLLEKCVHIPVKYSPTDYIVNDYDHKF